MPFDVSTCPAVPCELVESRILEPTGKETAFENVIVFEKEYCACVLTEPPPTFAFTYVVIAYVVASSLFVPVIVEPI